MYQKDLLDYLWKHFVSNAEQRLKAFNFFVVLSVFADGGAFAALEKGYPHTHLQLIGIAIILLVVVFAIVDQRSQALINLSKPGFLEVEKEFPHHYRIFTNDEKRFTRYTTAFRILFIAQALFGVWVIAQTIN